MPHPPKLNSKFATALGIDGRYKYNTKIIYKNIETLHGNADSFHSQFMIATFYTYRRMRMYLLMDIG